MNDWQLPEYIEDLLPPQAWCIEQLRRSLLDLFHVHGYQLVAPPLLEYTDSLLTGTGSDLDLQTFKLLDQLSGRLLGVRADITPQAARIDAHLLNRRGVTRLCYAGSVLHTLPSALGRTREPLQIGAELFGHAGVESDVEIQRLMLDALRVAGVDDMQLDLGHVAIFRALVERAALEPTLVSSLFHALQRKDMPALDELTASLDHETRSALTLLPDLYGGPEVLVTARRRLPKLVAIRKALDALQVIAQQLSGRGTAVGIDLGDLRGYHYHSGTVFTVYAQGRPTPVARGGRYDEVGKAFGRARAATGFSMD
ncbi:MAG: ATP phosphoribosyltransferase regulatory subunit, partial [Burkholderiales bacterium]